jgi:hypothetical protein
MLVAETTRFDTGSDQIRHFRRGPLGISLARRSQQSFMIAVRAAFVAAVALFVAGCGSEDVPTAPSPPAPASTVTGRITDIVVNEAVADADIVIVSGSNAGRRTSSDSVGRYSFADLVPGAGAIRVTSLRYVTSERVLDFMAGGVIADFALDRTTFELSGQVLDSRGYDTTLFGSNGQLPRVSVATGPNAGAVATPLTTGYRFDQLPWGTYTLRATEQGGTSRCFVPAEITVTVSAQDIANGTTRLVRNFAWTRQRGTVFGWVRSSRGGSRPGIPEIVFVYRCS